MRTYSDLEPIHFCDESEDDCDCWEYEEFDLIEGRARCGRCGRSRFVDSEEMRKQSELYAEWEQQYCEMQMLEDRQRSVFQRLAWSVSQAFGRWSRSLEYYAIHGRQTAFNEDDIPF